MIVTRIEALGFRSLRYVSQRLGLFHVLVGPNASGKSAFLDVLAFLGDLQRVGVAQAITGNASQDVPLRGGRPATSDLDAARLDVRAGRGGDHSR